LIYLRTSTVEQHPEKQKNECEQFAKDKGYEIIEVLEEQISGWKDIDRPAYNKVKELARKGKINAVIVWALDRWVRNRDTLLEDVSILRNYGCKIHSVKEAWLEAINIEGSLGKTIQDFLLGLLGSIAEMESQRKSERVKMAFVAHEKDDWGRPNLSNETIAEIIRLYNTGLSLRKISKTVTYWDSNKNKRNVSLGAVHKIISVHKLQLEQNVEASVHKIS
jgi:DNA invertase Pin-like site-specific DNA recombinase